MIEQDIEAEIIADLSTLLSGVEIVGLWQAETVGGMRKEPPLISVAVKPMYPPGAGLPFFDLPVVIEVIIRPESDPTKANYANWSNVVNNYVNGLVLPSAAITALDGDGYNVTGVTIGAGDAGYDGNDDIYFSVANFTVHITKC